MEIREETLAPLTSHVLLSLFVLDNRDVIIVEYVFINI